MEAISKVGNLSMIEQPGYVCSLDEFSIETTATNGSQLEVVDESTHKVVGYYLAYNGYWNER